MSAAKALGYAVHAFDAFAATGAAAPAPPVPPSPSDLCTIMYTSGTTGEPKGVMISHANMIAGVTTAVQFLCDVSIPMGPSDRFLSYLPLAHIFDRLNEEMFL